MKVVEVIKDLDKPNRNGRIYPKECFENLPKQIPVTLGSTDAMQGVQLEKVIGTADVDITDYPTMKVTCDIMKEKEDAILKSRPFELFFNTNGVGRVNDKGEVFDYNLVSMDVSSSTAFAETKVIIEGEK